MRERELKRASVFPLKVSTVDLGGANPLIMRGCTRLLSRLDGEVRNPHVLLRSPNMSNKKPNFRIQPTIT
jgi:hypothetical protein